MRDLLNNFYSLDKFAQEEFIKLNTKDTYAVNQFLKKNIEFIEKMEGDYIIYIDYDRSNNYLDYNDLSLAEFILKYLDDLKVDIENGYYPMITLTSNYEDIVYEGLLDINIKENSIHIKDKYGSLIIIEDTSILKVGSVDIVKCINKNIILKTVNGFVAELNNNSWFNNSVIKLFLYNQNKFIYIRKLGDKIELSKSNTFDTVLDDLGFEVFKHCEIGNIQINYI